MELNALTAIAPIDGRYRHQLQELAPYFSEYGLIYYRVRIEIEYFISLCQLPLPQLNAITEEQFSDLRAIYENFSQEDALEIKRLEKTTNHDVKAVEYFLKDKFSVAGLTSQIEFIHFGLTSQDVNNTAIPLSLKEAYKQIISSGFLALIGKLKILANTWQNIPMLARTHGQPASPTRLGKEIMVFVERLEAQMQLLNQVPFSAKFGGATGNFNAHYVAFPGTDWQDFGKNFVENTLGLRRSVYTTQIEHYDNMAAFFDGLKRLNTILIDFSRDIWQYISLGYFKQGIKAGEVGSSAMPHKVNPIDFENAEGNLGLANALFEFLAAKLPISRLQRDLTDSTVLRNVGVPLAHTLLALKSLHKGLNKIELNQPALTQDLEDNWAVVAEGIQTVLRREGYPQPYEALKALTRTNEKITAASITQFIDELEVAETIKKELKQITPGTYTGIPI